MADKIKEIWWEDDALLIKTFDNTIVKFNGAYIKDINYEFENDAAERIKLEKTNVFPEHLNTILVSELFNKKDI